MRKGSGRRSVGGHVSLALAGEGEGQGQDSESLRVGDLARESGKTVRAVHLYEELGLLEPASRSPGGFRQYLPDAVVRVRWIGKLQDMGFTLAEIREVVQSHGDSATAPDAMTRLRELYAQKLRETEAQIVRMKGLRAELEASLRYLHTCETCDPARLIDACVSCDVHGCDDRPPELVAGVHKG